MHSQMFYKIDVLKNYAKFTWKRLHQTLAQTFFWELFEILRNTFFSEDLQTTTASDFNSIFLEQISISLIF